MIGGAKPFYEAWFSITDPAQSGWAMSSALVGCVFGALISGWCADKLGRKLPLILSAVLFSASAWGRRSPAVSTCLWFHRIVGGVGIGLASALSPLYIAEVSPAEKKRALCCDKPAHYRDWRAGRSAYQPDDCGTRSDGGDAADDCGDLERADGLALDVRRGTGAGAGVFGADVFVPESPRWLMKAGKPDRARAALERIGSADYADRILRDIAHTLEKR